MSSKPLAFVGIPLLIPDTFQYPPTPMLVTLPNICSYEILYSQQWVSIPKSPMPV